MTLLVSISAVLGGLAALIWSADRFVDGSSMVARHYQVSPLIIGMIIIGFGTSAPEMVVSLFASLQGNPGIALGNAYGSNIANLGLIIGVTAIVSPILVQSSIVRRELPILMAVTAFTAWILWDGTLGRTDGVSLMILFGALMGWSIRQSKTPDILAGEVDVTNPPADVPLRGAVLRLVGGLVLLIASSRVLVWGAVDLATRLGVSDLVIGLTVIAIGTSLPELASSISAVRKGQYDMAIGNVIGSNLFNTLVVVGIASLVHPLEVPNGVLSRDVSVMAVMTLFVAVFGVGLRRQGRINRVEGGLLVAGWAVYTVYLVVTV